MKQYGVWDHAEEGKDSQDFSSPELVCALTTTTPTTVSSIKTTTTKELVLTGIIYWAHTRLGTLNVFSHLVLTKRIVIHIFKDSFPRCFEGKWVVQGHLVKWEWTFIFLVWNWRPDQCAQCLWGPVGRVQLSLSACCTSSGFSDPCMSFIVIIVASGAVTQLYFRGVFNLFIRIHLEVNMEISDMSLDL